MNKKGLIVFVIIILLSLNFVSANEDTFFSNVFDSIQDFFSSITGFVAAAPLEDYIFTFDVNDTWNISDSFVRVNLNEQTQDINILTLIANSTIIVDASEYITIEPGTLYADIVVDDAVVFSGNIIIEEEIVEIPEEDIPEEPIENVTEEIVEETPIYNIDEDSKIKDSVKEDIQGKEQKDKIPVIIKVKANKNKIKGDITNLGGNLKDMSDTSLIASEIEVEDFEILTLDVDVLEIWPDREVEGFMNESVYQIKADSLWNLGLNGSGIKVAILDTGVNNANVILEQDFTGTGVQDNNGHGSFVAEIVTAVASDVEIYSGKVLDDTGSGHLSWVINGIDWAIAQDVDVISLSLGATYSENPEDLLTAPEVLKVEEAVANGITVVIASGNCRGGCNGFYGVTTPGIAESAITVGAVDDNNGLAYFSSGDTISDYIKPDLVAPGVNICSDVCYSGTSMSTPHVTGGVALLLQDDSLSPGVVKNMLENGALDLGDLGKDTSYGSGLLDLSNIFEVSAQGGGENYSLVIPELSAGVESKFVLEYNNTENSNRQIKVSWNLEELDFDFSQSVEKTVPKNKVKDYNYEVTPTVPGLHVLSVVVSEDGEVLHSIERVVSVDGYGYDYIAEVSVQYV